jgi:CRISPR-associated exonuclease Cas4
MFSEDDLLPLSALQHYVYCPRQAALIHLERAWTDNVLTAEGTHLHGKADAGQRESRGATIILRAVALRSFVYGLSGKADVVELHQRTDDSIDTVLLENQRWCVQPVEYKRGKPKKYREDEVQLCAQALCLEEMLGVHIAEGHLFYGTTRRRKLTVFDSALRELTASTAVRMHALFAAGVTPRAEPGPKCKNCSLNEICKPTAAERSARGYVVELLRSSDESK